MSEYPFRHVDKYNTDILFGVIGGILAVLVVIAVMVLFLLLVNHAIVLFSL